LRWNEGKLESKTWPKFPHQFAFLEMQTLFALLMKEGFKWNLVPNQDLRKVTFLSLRLVLI